MSALIMKTTYSWLIYSCLIFGSSILCDNIQYQQIPQYAQTQQYQEYPQTQQLPQGRRSQQTQQYRQSQRPRQMSTSQIDIIQRPSVSTSSGDINDMFYCSNGLRIQWSLTCDDYMDCLDGSDETTELCGRYNQQISQHPQIQQYRQSQQPRQMSTSQIDIIQRPPSVSTSLGDIDDMFYCSNGLRIEWLLACDGNMDCLDGSDETKELCARYEYGTNISMDCGTVSKEMESEHTLEETPWIVDIYTINKKSNNNIYLGLGSIISQNVVVAATKFFWEYGIQRKQNAINDKSRYLFKIDIPLQTDNDNTHYYIDAKIIYLFDDVINRATIADLAVIVLANKISFSNGVTPVCIDWYSKYNLQDGAHGMIAGYKGETQHNHTVLQRFFFPHIYNCSYVKRRVEYSSKLCISLRVEQSAIEAFNYQILSFLHSSSYFLTGINSYPIALESTELYFVDITYYVPRIRGILNKHSTANSCVLPTVEGIVYSYEGSHSVLSPGTLINPNITVIENCEVGYHKARPNCFRVCQRYGIWKTDSDKLCLKMCPPLLSDSVDIKCRYNGEYANCSNHSIPDTIATPKCKPTYDLPNGIKDTPLELHCLSNGLWNNELYKCNPNPSSSCVLPTVEGVVYTHEDSNEHLSHGKLIRHGVTVNENCTFGYHNAYPNSFRVCQKNGKWKIISEKLCLKMCPPLLSHSLDIKCTYNGKYANCSNLSIPDTIAIPKCRATYSLPNGKKETPIELHCHSNGMWDNELYICEPDCGAPFIKPQIMINNGETANVGTAPWNVAIYKKISEYKFLCGGSIISRNLVVSAAHCFWTKGMPYNIKIFDDLYKVAVGKYYKSFKIYDSEYPQIKNVDRIHLKDSYNGAIGHYAEDIAVVVLQNSVSFGNGITPVCMDWDGIYNVSNGDEGKIVGWGKTEKGMESPILLKTGLPYINMTTCRDMYKSGFASYVTHDKCCAGSSLVSGHGVDGGDSGAGLCFSHSKLYYLTGVVSLKEAYSNNSIALFTSVNVHIQWILGLYLEYKKTQYN